MYIEENKTNNLSNPHKNKFCNNMLSNIVILHVNEKKMKRRCFRGKNMKFPCFFFSNNFSFHFSFETPSRPWHFYRLLTWNQSCHSLKTHCERDINKNIYLQEIPMFLFFYIPHFVIHCFLSYLPSLSTFINECMNE